MEACGTDPRRQMSGDGSKTSPDERPQTAGDQTQDTKKEPQEEPKKLLTAWTTSVTDSQTHQFY